MTVAVRAETSLHDHFAAVRTPWGDLLAQDDAASVFATPGWLRTWWDAFGRGQLVCAVVSDAGRPTGLASLFVEDGMAYPVGSGGSDYLDLLGDRANPEVWTSLLRRLFSDVPGLGGIRWYHVPSWSPSHAALRSACSVLGLRLEDEGGMPAPLLDLRAPGAVAEALGKKSVRRNENWFARDGDLAVRHHRDVRDIVPLLDEFFDQHERRWDGTDSPSLFKQSRHRDFYRSVADAGSREGWLRFTEVVWRGRPVAFHFGSCLAGRYLWYKPSFDIGTPKSPGEVLLTSLIRAAVDEGARVFDFGLGDEPFKQRFATDVGSVTTWGIYA